MFLPTVLCLPCACPVSAYPYTCVGQAIKDGGRIVVCCRGGESRSPAIVIAYLIQAKKASYDSVYADVEATCPGDPYPCTFARPCTTAAVVWCVC